MKYAQFIILILRFSLLLNVECFHKKLSVICNKNQDSFLCFRFSFQYSYSMNSVVTDDDVDSVVVVTSSVVVNKIISVSVEVIGVILLVVPDDINDAVRVVVVEFVSSGSILWKEVTFIFEFNNSSFELCVDVVVTFFKLSSPPFAEYFSMKFRSLF
jgi:hypothetical protein